MKAEGPTHAQDAAFSRRVAASGASTSRPATPGASLIPLLLLLLSLLDLRVEILLLIDHFTLTSLVQAITSHPLAVVVLLLQRSLWRHYRRR
ncbi:MAG: hypothetical protein ACK5N0_05665 [Synechococcaceae cyanobacterium]